MFQQEHLPAPKPDKYDPSLEVKESPPEKSDIEKLKESLQEREEREAELKQALERAGAEIQKYREELDRAEAEIQKYRDELETVKIDIKQLKPLTSKLQNLKTEHDKELSKTRDLIDEVSKDLKPKLKEVDLKRSMFETTTTNRFTTVKAEVKTAVLSEVRKDFYTQMLSFQQNMKEEFEKTVRQLEDRMKTEMSEMQCAMLQQFVSITNDQSQKIDELRREVLSHRQRLDDYDRRQQNWEFARDIVRELREKPGDRQEHH